MRTRIHSALVTIHILLASAALLRAQGSLTPPGAPAPTMKTLDQVQPRTPISSLPLAISLPGSYYVTGNLTGVAGQHGITINADHVTLDLSEFDIAGHRLQSARMHRLGQYGRDERRHQSQYILHRAGLRGHGQWRRRHRYEHCLHLTGCVAENNASAGFRCGAGECIVGDCTTHFNGAARVCAHAVRELGAPRAVRRVPASLRSHRTAPRPADAFVSLSPPREPSRSIRLPIALSGVLIRRPRAAPAALPNPLRPPRASDVEWLAMLARVTSKGARRHPSQLPDSGGTWLRASLARCRGLCALSRNINKAYAGGSP